MTLHSQTLFNTISRPSDRPLTPFNTRRGAIGYFLIVIITFILLTAMGIFSSVRKGSEHGVFYRFHTKARNANMGAALEARLGIVTPWNPSAAPTTYTVYVDTNNPTTVTIDSIGMP